MTAVRAEIVVAVHDPARPIERAVASILRSGGAGVLVVVHNTDAGAIRARLAEVLDDPRVRVIELHDGIPSPSGPFNAGIDAASTPFVGIMGSDDELEPGAVDHWLDVQRRTGAEIVIARIAHARPYRGIPTPPVRVPARRRVDGVKDRLSYRSAPLGIWDREAFGSMRFVPEVTAGEDIPFVTELWFSGRPIAYAGRGPAYLVHADSDKRVSTSARPVSADMAFLDELRSVIGRMGLGPAARDAIVRKVLRVNVFGLLANRAPDGWSDAQRHELADAAERVLAVGSTPRRALSIAERRLVRAILSAAPVGELYPLLAAARRRTNPAAVVTRNPLRVFSRDAPIRFGLASLAAARTPRGRRRPG